MFSQITLFHDVFIRVYFQCQRGLTLCISKIKLVICSTYSQWMSKRIGEDRMFSDDLCCKMHSDFLFTCIQEENILLFGLLCQGGLNLKHSIE